MTKFKKMIEYITNLWYHKYNNKSRGGGDMTLKVIKNLEKKAKDILIENDMLRLPVDLSEIAKNNNIDVYISELPDGIYVAIRYNNEKKKFEILIEKNESNVRQRFTLAHELAHFFLERHTIEYSGKVHFDTLFRKEKNIEEREVEYLAGAILMDKEILIRLYKINSSIKDLAKVFDVSESAMTVRLSILDLL